MSRYFLKISFKGTEYHGWQVQPGTDSVQGTIERALCLLLRENIVLTGAGRTDAGVHAINFIAHFDSVRADLHEGNDFKYKMNSFLPGDIVIQEIYLVKETDHARYDAVSRTYHYIVTLYKNPLLREYSHRVYGSINMDKMNEACRIIKDNDDFTSFSKLHGNNKTNICRIEDIHWNQPSDGILVLRISADRFLRGMVRALVGTMLDTGSGKVPPEIIQDILTKKDRSLAGMAAPAKGLFFSNVSYPENTLPDVISASPDPLFPLSELFL